jgi:uncharacterized protein (TIGR00106 family)
VVLFFFFFKCGNIRTLNLVGREWNMIASLSVYPIGQGTSLSRFVSRGVAVIKESGLPFEIGPMSTSFEAQDLEAIFEVVKKVHAAHVAEGAQRVVIELKVDDRRDKKATILTKKESVA